VLCIIRNYLIFAAMLVLAGANCRYQKTIDEKGENENLVRLVEALDSDDWATRERASKQIATLGPACVARLKAFEGHGSLEVRCRLDEILYALETGSSLEHSRRIRALVSKVIEYAADRSEKFRQPLPDYLLELVLSGRVGSMAIRKQLSSERLSPDQRYLLVKWVLEIEGEDAGPLLGAQLPLLGEETFLLGSLLFRFLNEGNWGRAWSAMMKTALSNGIDPLPYVKVLLITALENEIGGAEVESAALKAVQKKETRLLACSCLVMLGNKRAKEIYLKLLDSSNAEERQRAAIRLMNLEAREHLDRIMKAVRSVPDSEAFCWVSLADWIDVPSVKEFLTSKTSPGQNKETRHKAMRALVLTGKKECLPYMEQLWNEGNEKMKCDVLWQLVPRFGRSEKALTMIHEVMKSDREDTDLGWAARAGLSKMEGPKVTEIVLQDVRHSFAGMNRSDDMRWKECLIRNRRHLKEKDVLDLLERVPLTGLGVVNALKDDRYTAEVGKIAFEANNTHILRPALTTLRSIGSEKAIDMLLKIAKASGDSLVHLECLKALETSPRRSECSWIKTFLRNKPRYLQAQALRALAAISPENALKQYKNVIEESDSSGRPEAITLLGVLPLGLTDRLLGRLWQEGDDRQKVAVARAYMMQGNPDVLDSLIDLCSRRGNYVRIAVSFGYFSILHDLPPGDLRPISGRGFSRRLNKDIEVSIEFDAALWAMHMLRKIVPCAKDLVYTESEESWQSKLAKVRKWSEANRGKTSFQTDENTPWW